MAIPAIKKITLGITLALVGCGVALFSFAALAANDDYPYKVPPYRADANLGQPYGLAGECVSFVIWRLRNTNHVNVWSSEFGDATNWGREARALGYKIDTTPAPGAVAWWSGGHVMWVESVNGNNVTIEDYNWNYTHSYREHPYTIAQLAGMGFVYIHIHDLSSNATQSSSNGTASSQQTATDKGYSSQFVTESSGYISLATGNTSTQWIDYKNTGSQTWYDSVSAAAAGVMPVHLATSHPLGRKSIFGASWGGDDNRAAVDFDAVFNADDKTPTPNSHVVEPGQVGRFAFVLSAPSNAAPGTYQEYFEPLQEGGTTMNDPGTYMYIVVAQPNYSSSFVTESSGYYTLAPGSQSTAWFEYRNTGNEPWYDSVSAGAAGVMPVHLATSHPLSRTSAFGSTWGGDDNRAAVDFDSVYEPDGTTLAPDQHVVWPNYVVKFSFVLTVPANEPTGTYQEFFEPLQEGGTIMNDPGTYLYVNVP